MTDKTKEQIERIRKLNRKRGKLLDQWHNKYMTKLFEPKELTKKDIEEILHGYTQAMNLHYLYNCEEQKLKEVL